MESIFDNYHLELEDRPLKISKHTLLKGGKDIFKMSKSKTNEPVAPAVYNKSKGEHTKDIIIAILVAGVISFIGGMYFANHQNDQIKQAVSTATATETVKK